MEETREQQQMYSMFRSCIYVILIVEIVMNLPITTSNPMIGFVLDVFHRFKVFDSIGYCKVMEFICITVTCIGTKAQKSLRWNLKTMVLYPIVTGLTMTILCFIFHSMHMNGSFAGYPLNRCLYVLCSIVGTMLIHQGLDAIAKYLNMRIGDDKWNFGNETYIDIQIVTLYLYLFLVNFWLNLSVWQREFRGKKEGSNRRTTMQHAPFGRSVRILCKDREYYAD